MVPTKDTGGTEVDLSGLVRELRTLNISSRIISPLGLEAADGYKSDGTAVRVYSVSPRPHAPSFAAERRTRRFRQILAELKVARGECGPFRGSAG